MTTPPAAGRLLHMVAVGLDPEHHPLLDALGAALHARLGIVPVQRPPLDILPAWRGPTPATLRSNALIDALVAAASEDSGRGVTDWTLALTSADLVAPGRPFVFGEATLNGPCALVSLARLDDPTHARAAERLERRLLTEALHEIGHLAGLPHCQVTRCVMHPSATPADIDRKGPERCGRCARSLPGAP